MQGLADIRIPTKQSNEVCPIHQVHLVSYGKMKPFCEMCTAQKINEQKRNLVINFEISNIKNVLKRDSLVDDPNEKKYTFSNFNAEEGTKEWNIKNQARHIAYRYLNGDDKFNTIFYGTPGEGKTHLAMSMLNAVNDNANPLQKCLFVNVNSLLLTIRKSFDNPEWQWTEEYAVNKLSDVDLLVIDDLGSESAMNITKGEASNFVQRVLYQVTNRQKRIITTTNLSLDQLKRVYNPKLVSRLLANSRNSTIDFSGIADKRF